MEIETFCGHEFDLEKMFKFSYLTIIWFFSVITILYNLWCCLRNTADLLIFDVK